MNCKSSSWRDRAVCACELIARAAGVCMLDGGDDAIDVGWEVEIIYSSIFYQVSQ